MSTSGEIDPSPGWLQRLWARRATVAPFAVAGALSVLAGGIVAAAIAAPTPTRHGVWSVAYLVLVVGLCQIALGAGQALLAATPPTRKAVWTAAVVFNLANVGVLAGVLTDRVAVLNAGSVLLLVALVLFLVGVRRSDRRGWALHLYRGVVTVLVVSIPIGLVITTVGAT
ncbi:hypothetical protein H7J07_12775 [Mycobacterium koreense]|uniref:Uncharacterized protein n=1 Tax=Mycolicibacillus koreensis TaxID=1069220 RepID=A0A7I7SCG5_9MYCO|nr:hypothetical protein [Mycolicibacillus koreensis]MCV7249088.1 hypothetical protein [Mycolicibacillus koreensis]OSC34135.1 hypothetical protein B8W67_08265 [Mycolicibacillus koreensis]BBY54602.1 hypothetical protein MKOR_18530 [Mycolicibacillus koreensis]